MQHVHLDHHLLVTAPGSPVLVFQMQVQASCTSCQAASLAKHCFTWVAMDSVSDSHAGGLPHTTIGTQPLEDIAEAAEQQHVPRQGNPHCSYGTL